jgi:hypothetical protein
VHQRHQVPQEIRGSEVEGPAVHILQTLNGSAALPFVIPTGGAQWRDLQCAPRTPRISRIKPQPLLSGSYSIRNLPTEMPRVNAM